MKTSWFGLLVVLEATALLVMFFPRPASPQAAKKKFDIAVVVDQRLLRGEKNWDATQEAEMVATWTLVIRAIIQASGELSQDYNLKIGVGSYDGTSTLTSLSPSQNFFDDPPTVESNFDKGTKAELLPSQQIPDDISFNVRTVSEWLREEDRKNRPDAEDVFIWVTLSKTERTDTDDLNSWRTAMENKLEKLFNNGRSEGVDGIIAVEQITPRPSSTENVTHRISSIFQTSSGWPLVVWMQDAPVVTTTQWKEVVKTRLGNLFGSCTSVNVAEIGCRFNASKACIKTKKYTSAVPLQLQKFCGMKMGSFDEPCGDLGNVSVCVQICTALRQQDGEDPVQRCSVTTCGTHGIRIVRPSKAVPGSLHEHCPNVSLPCVHPACPTKPGELPPEPTVPYYDFSPPIPVTIAMPGPDPDDSTLASTMKSTSTGQLETWHIVVIVLSATALLSIVVIVIVCILMSARKRRAKARTHLHGPHYQRQSPDRRYSPRHPKTDRGNNDRRHGADRYSKQQARSGGDRSKNARYTKQSRPGTDQPRDDYRRKSPSRPSVNTGRR